MCFTLSRASEDDIHNSALVRTLTRNMSWFETRAVLAHLIVDDHDMVVNVATTDSGVRCGTGRKDACAMT